MMKSMTQSTIIRKADKLGRLVIPKEMRRSLGWDETTPICISPFGRYILLKCQDAPQPVHDISQSPILLDIQDALAHLSDADLLLVLEILCRLAQ